MRTGVIAALLGAGLAAAPPATFAQGSDPRSPSPTGDRYGPAARPTTTEAASGAFAAVQAAPARPRSAPLRRVLTWEGKATPASAPRAADAIAASPPTSRASSAPASPRVAAAAPSGGTARYYSLHRAYGMAPDPAPIPPTFFGPTADLSTPETEEAARRASATASASSARSAVNAARLVGEAVP